jgi:hypothetical protein
MSKALYKYLRLELWWLRLGIKAGWISKPYCATHDGNYEYMTEEENRQEWDEGFDPCTHVMVVLE